MFGAVVGAVRLPDGTIVVADRLEMRMHMDRQARPVTSDQISAERDRRVGR